MNRIPLIKVLEAIDSSEARVLITITLLGAIQTIRDGRLSIAQGERIIFNTEILRFCQNQLGDSQLVDAISYGMELEDIQQLVESPQQAVSNACNEIEALLLTVSQ